MEAVVICEDGGSESKSGYTPTFDSPVASERRHLLYSETA
jgi:hypothetical protein